MLPPYSNPLFWTIFNQCYLRTSFIWTFLVFPMKSFTVPLVHCCSTLKPKPPKKVLSKNEVKKNRLEKGIKASLQHHFLNQL